MAGTREGVSLTVMRLKADGLACTRGGREVFRGLSFVLIAGEGMVVTGRNGAGKSSLLRMIAGLIRISAGHLDFDGGNPELPLAEHCHYLGHQDAMKPSLSVGENLEFWTAFFGADLAVAPALDTVDLRPLADLPAAFLSAGQRRRLSIARLVAVPRPIWLLDEPTSALDITSQKILSELMSSHLSSGGIIVAAAHGPIGLEHARELKLGLA